MFQLVVAVISIGLFVSLTLAGAFYGGEAFTKAQERAEARADAKGELRIQTTAPKPMAFGDGRWIVTDSY